MTGTQDTLAARSPVEGALAVVREEPGLVAMTLAAVAGLAISIYLTTVHYMGAPLVCTNSGAINCSAVTTSKYSVVPATNLPITIPGMLWFVVSGGLAAYALVAQRRQRPESERLRLFQLLWGAAGMAFVLYLVYAEIVLIHNICEWCTVIHLLTLVTFLVALYRFQQARLLSLPPPRSRASAVAARTHGPPRSRPPQRPRGRRH